MVTINTIVYDIYVILFISYLKDMYESCTFINNSSSTTSSSDDLLNTSSSSSSSSADLHEDDEGNVHKVPKDKIADPDIFKKRMIERIKEQTEEVNIKNVNVKYMLMMEDEEDILRIIQKYPILLDKFTTQALISGLLSGELSMYEFLVSEEGEPDLTKIVKCAVCWKSESMLQWCRDNMTEDLDTEQRTYISFYLNILCTDPKEGAGNNEEWIKLIK